MEKQTVRLAKPIVIRNSEHEKTKDKVRRKLLTFKEFTEKYREMSRKPLPKQKPQPIAEGIDGANPGDSLYCHIPAGAPNRRQLVDQLAFTVLRFCETTDVVVIGVGVEPEED